MIFVDDVNISPYLHFNPNGGVSTLDPDAPEWAKKYWEERLAAREKMSEGILTGKCPYEIE